MSVGPAGSGFFLILFGGMLVSPGRGVGMARTEASPTCSPISPCHTGPLAEGPAGCRGSGTAGGPGTRTPAPAPEQGLAAAHLAPGQTGAGAGAEAGGEQH